MPHLSHSLSVHHPPTLSSSCSICPTLFQFTTHQRSISNAPSVSLPFFSPPTDTQFHLSYLSHSLSVHHPPPFNFSCPICPTSSQFTTHQHSISLVPSVSLTFISPLTNTQFLLSHLSHSLSVHHPPTLNFSCPNRPTLFQFTTHRHSLPSTNHAAPHCSVLFIPLLLPLS